MLASRQITSAGGWKANFDLPSPGAVAEETSTVILNGEER